MPKLAQKQSELSDKCLQEQGKTQEKFKPVALCVCMFISQMPKLARTVGAIRKMTRSDNKKNSRPLLNM